MNKNIRLLVEGFFDDEIFDVENDIKSDLEDLGRYYNVGDIYYLNKTPYAICCGESKYFKDNKPRFCLLNNYNKDLEWGKWDKFVKELKCFKFENFDIKSFNDFKHIDEDGYGNTQIIKNNYDIKEFPAFKYCINLGNNVYLPAINELLMMLLNKDKLGKYSFSNNYYWSNTLNSSVSVYYISTNYNYVAYINKFTSLQVRPFFRLD